MDIKEFFNFGKKNRLSLILGAAATVAAIVTLILYVTTGVTNFTSPKLDGMMVAMLIVGAIVSCAAVVFDFKLLKYGAFVALLVAFVKFIVFEIDYIANIFTSIDPTEITAAFVLTLVLAIVGFVAALVAAIVCPDKIETLSAKEE